MLPYRKCRINVFPNMGYVLIFVPDSLIKRNQYLTKDKKIKKHYNLSIKYGESIEKTEQKTHKLIDSLYETYYSVNNDDED